MKNVFLSSVIATATLASCSTVSSIMQNTFPYSATIIVTQGSPANTQLSAIGVGNSINQLFGSSANVRDIRLSSATLSVTSGNQSMGVFKSVKVYLSSGSSEVLVASRTNIADNIGSTLSLDLNSSQTLDNIMKSGNTVQQRIVYELKSSPTSDMNVKSSMSFSSVPVTN